MKSTMHNLPYWLAINEKRSIFTNRQFFNILSSLDRLEELWYADRSKLENLDLDTKTINAFMKYRNNVKIEYFENLINELAQRNITIIKLDDPLYPASLKTINNPPLLLYHKGELLNFNNCIAIIGTRNASFHARSIARKLGTILSDNGYTIVSGLARGIDEEAHCGALESKGGKSIAVLPVFEPIYPPEHEQLLYDIEKRGARLSEYYKRSFSKFSLIERNRITSGISKCLIAIESDNAGGTVRQVQLAKKQGKAIFVLVPKDNERAKRGYALFVRMGAIPFKTIDELLDYLAEYKTINKTLEAFTQR